jgi:soluble lytic murein transglycosylase
VDRLCHRPAGEQLQSARYFKRACRRVNADDARCRPLRRQQIWCALDEKRLLNDETYNALGTAELGDLIKYYRGSYILSFAGYNAGRGRVKDWIAKYGDPRDPKIDPIDWIERIPFSETRNYVQRVLESLEVYRVRFGGGSKLLTEADLRRGAKSN